VPPFAGFDESVEEEMIEFLEQRVGTFDLYGEIESGDAFVRYCFARIEDAQAFHSRFAAVAAQGALSRGQLKAAPAPGKS
jgi:hypothetical protein